ncbi:MAG: aminopeptidase P family protein [Clostridia bacterium]|nr:aminopeptidase P family protein [Clostridia bacterium]
MINRIKRLRESFDSLGVDAILVTSQTNHRYFTKFDNGDGCLLITRKNAYAFEDFRYTEIAEKLLKDVYTVIQLKGKRSAWLGDAIKSENIKCVGIEDYSMSLNSFAMLKNDLPEVEFKNIGATISLLRQVKDEWEIQQIRKAQEITDLAFEHILGIISTEITETDVAAELEYFMRKHGAEDKSFETISISAEKTSLPHGVPENVKIKKGFFTMDFGATVNGYHSDMTRTICVGKADNEMKKLYNTVLKAQLASIEYLNAGVVCRDADNIAREIINKDYNGLFGHSLGHSVGLEIHEVPCLAPTFDKILVPNNVVTVEPGIYVAGKYGCRIEDLVVIKENGIENLTKSPKELIEL